MKNRTLIVAAAILVSFAAISMPSRADDAKQRTLPTAIEAKARAELLHETIHGVLQAVHRDFFSDEGGTEIPSRSLEDVFRRVEEEQGVSMEWLIVDTDILNVDHAAADDFEKDAVEAIKAGAERIDRVEENRLRYAGRIHMASQCLKCHVKVRTDTEPRSAALLISMPVRSDRKTE